MLLTHRVVIQLKTRAARFTYLTAKLCGKDAEAYNFNAIHRWVSKRVVGYNIFRCDTWAIPINFKEAEHWVVVHVVLPRIACEGVTPTECEVRYSDSDSTKVSDCKSERHHGMSYAQFMESL
jgi:hypothetical protein